MSFQSSSQRSRNFVVLSAALSGIILISCAPQSGSPIGSGDEASSISASSSSPSPAASSFAAISSSVPKASSAPFTRKTYYDAKTGFTFWHPARLTVIAPNSFTIQTGEVGYEIKSPTIDEGYGVLSVLEDISVVLKPDAREKSNGPVTKQDVYSPPGGNLSRHYVLYTGKYRVTVYANYDVFPAFYKGKYEPADGFSITDLVKRDLGGDLSNPIHRLIAVYPNEKTLKQFYQDADAIVNSMGVVPTVSSAATEAVQMPERSPKETYVRLNTELRTIKTYADFEAIVLKYGSVAKIAEFLEEVREIPEAQRDQLVPEIQAEILSPKEIATIQESVNGNTATLRIATNNGPLKVTLVKEGNQWKVEDESRP